MSQHDYDIANQSFPAFRTDLNNVLGAINSSNSGSSRPSSAVAGTVWLDTSGGATAHILKFYDGGADITLATINTTANTVDFADSSITLADDSVTLAKMAGGTDGNLISYDTSGNPVAVATGSAGQVLTSAGAGAVPSFATLPAGGLQSTQLFTSSGTYTRPSGITKIRVFVTAGGGGGGGCDTNSPNYISGAGGGAGGTAIELIDASGTFANVTVTIGAGGAGGDGSAGGTTANGQNGGTSSFGSYCSATGGTGGPKANNLTVSTYVQGGVGSNADLDLRGNSGGGATEEASSEKLGGRGGGSYWGGGGSGTIGNTASAGLHGSGGGGTASTPIGRIRDGGAGGSGIVYVEEYA